ncbi:MAG: BamA/TamA family outer membrane protein [Crocinitomicaceae bacterium]|nr:BamA/TamA family outer membrane protein [Crocinitomicaceae bacterium]
MEIRQFSWTKVTFCSLFLLFIFDVSAQDSIKAKKIKVLPVPAFGYSPETKTYLGAVCLFNLNLYDDTLTRSSNAKIEFNYTWLKQIIAETEWNYFFKEENWFTSGLLHFSKYPDRYYGIGADRREEDQVWFQSNRFKIDLNGLRRVQNKWFAGLELRYLNYFNFEQDSVVYSELASENRSGLGLVVVNDSRDHILTPTKGSFLRVTNNYNFGRTTYSQLIVDARKYYGWGKKMKQVLSLRAFTKHIIGDAPFFDLALLGGDDLTRGYIYGRFRDNNLTSVQTEYRTSLFWRVGIAAFGGVTLTYPQFNSIQLNSIKPNAGLGIRFLVDKEEGTNLRFDYAIGQNGQSGFYISFGESF